MYVTFRYLTLLSVINLINLEILKTDPDRVTNSEMKNQRTRTSPCETN